MNDQATTDLAVGIHEYRAFGIFDVYTPGGATGRGYILGPMKRIGYSGRDRIVFSPFNNRLTPFERALVQSAISPTYYANEEYATDEIVACC